ncbi:Ig-like domain-containing protein [Orenia marismortui]|uniref:Ig-like domain-containing protein n=1 Tax=Orenia marismortui TaxID=46469 RepID=UPI000360C6B2|nr:Ig-like domain-containing protein [Orenia marismortui]
MRSKEFYLLVLLILVIGLVGCSSSSGGGGGSELGILKINVPKDAETGEIIANYTIEIINSDGAIVKTIDEINDGGEYDFKPGTYNVEVTATGYEKWSRSYIVKADDPMPVIPKLTKKSTAVEIEELSVDPSQITVSVGDTYELPQFATATMTDGSASTVKVNWNKEVDTSVAGTYEFIGSVEGTELTVIFKLIVTDEERFIESLDINPKEATVEVGNSYSLPATATASYNDGSEETVDIIWDKEVDTSVAGTYEFIGSVGGTELTVSFKLIVKEERTIESLDINPKEATVQVGSNYSLPATATASYNDGSEETVDIIWDKEVDTSVAGTYEFIGSVEGTELTVNFKLIVKEGIFIENLAVNPSKAIVGVGEEYTLAATGTATMSDGTTKEVNLTWEDSDGNIVENGIVDTSVAGTYEFIGSTAGTELTVGFTLTVIDESAQIGIEVDWETAPKAPVSLSSTLDNSAITLSWDDSEEGIAGYLVYRSTEVTGEKTPLTYSLITDTKTYVDENVEAGTTYYYWVVSYRKSSNGGFLGSDLSEALEVTYAAQ